jgi:hypothetical protein
MSLLREIQTALVSGTGDIGPVLLKLRLLSSKLGVPSLEEWVKFEAEGYPDDVDLPDYRHLAVSYTASFSGPFGSGIKNAPIPPYLIEKFAGKSWTSYAVRQSIASIDNLVSSADSGSLTINASDLMLLLQGNVYKDYACNAVYGQVSVSALVEIQNAVRSRILELTIQLERSAPNSAEMTLGQPLPEGQRADLQAVAGSFHQIVYGNYTAINNSGSSAQISVSVQTGDIKSFASELVRSGISESDARDLASIVESEKPDLDSQPFGRRAREWLKNNLSKALDGTWKIGIGVATKVVEEAAKRYYGLS